MVYVDRSFAFCSGCLLAYLSNIPVGIIPVGVGLAILQSAANPYVTIVGPIESAAKRMSIVGTGNKLAGVIANLILAAVVIRESDKVLMRDIEAGNYTGESLETALDTLIMGV
jgi:fucose permease